jgi:Mce-associated membrane protein
MTRQSAIATDTATAPPEELPVDAETPTNVETPLSAPDSAVATPTPRRRPWVPILSYAVLPAAALLLAVAAGWLKWTGATIDDSQRAAAQSVQAATDATIALLSYKPDSVAAELGAARERTTGSFRDAYSSLTHDVVIPGAQQKKITATATVPAAGSISATATHAVVMVFVNQTVTIAGGPPSSTASTVRVTLDKSGAQWLVAGFDPI